MGKRMPTPEALRDLFRYEPETGLLFWKARTDQWFKAGARSAQWAANVWNTKFAGKEAFTCVNPSGYRMGAVLSVFCLSHRVAYAIHHGVEPDGEIDHINGDPSDNRASNLRLVTHAENSRNVAIYSSNKSGTPGVRWEESHKAWSAKINFNGKQRRIGRFKVKADAVAARKNAEVVHGYHPNHGRAAIGG